MVVDLPLSPMLEAALAGELETRATVTNNVDQ